MKPKTFSYRPILLGIFLLGITLALASWDVKHATGYFRHPSGDTVPEKKGNSHIKKARDLDEVLEELDNVNIDVDMDQINKNVTDALKNFDKEQLKIDIDNALKSVDMAKIQKDVAASMAKIDWEGIKKDVNESMNKVDWDEMKKGINESMSKIDWDQMKKGVDESMKNIDWSAMNKNMDELKKMNFDKLDIDMKNLDINLKDIGPEIEKAKQKVQLVKVEMHEYKDFVDELQNDGLINKKETYSIRHKNGELIINGKKATPEVYSKYRTFLEKHEKFSIEKTSDDFNIDMD